MSTHAGGCLCTAIRYKTRAAPHRVTICHRKFCQRITGTAYLVESIFGKKDIEITAGEPKAFMHRSTGSGKEVTLHFCQDCGCNIYLSFERFPDVVGVFSGTFDDPNWFERTIENSKHIFTRSAQSGVILPPGINTFPEHTTQNDGTPNEPVVYTHAFIVHAGKQT